MTLSQEEAEAPKPLVAPFAIAQPSASRVEPAAPIPGAPWAGMPAPEVPMFDDPETVDTAHHGAVLRTLDLERHVVPEDAELQTIDIEIVDDEDDEEEDAAVPVAAPVAAPVPPAAVAPAPAPAPEPASPAPVPAAVPAPEPATKESWSWATVASPSEQTPAPPPSRPAPIPKPPVRSSLYGKFSNKKK